MSARAAMLRGLLAAGLGLLAFACVPADPTGAGGSGTPDAGAGGTERSVERGPVRVRVTLDRDSLTIADHVTLRIEAEAEAGVDLVLPEPEEIPLEPFTVRRTRDERPAREGDRVVAAREFELEPFLSGEYTIGPVPVRFTLEGADPEPDGSRKVYTAEVEPLPLRVESLTEQASAALDIRANAGPAEIARDPVPSRLPWIAVGAVAGLLALVLLGWWLRRRRTVTVDVARSVPPREAALAALRDLESRDLLARGRVREFYFEIGMILREFIEAEFGLRAAEETTEEFLEELTRESRFHEETKALLARFLEHCDLVKFAKYAPEDREIRETVQIVRDFLERSSASAPSTEPLAAAGAPSQEVGHGA